MRREPLFNRDGFYGFVVRSNVLLHREAMGAAERVLRAVLARGAVSEVRLLDLACGAQPVIPTHLMRAFPHVAFRYQGVDINADQVAGARRHPFPANAVDVHVHEGSAWDLADQPLAGPFDLVCMGMNLHHGTPEEIHLLLTQVRERLADHGAFFDHDWFRPPGEPYQRRPDHDRNDPRVSYALVDPQRLPPLEWSVPEWSGDGDPAWRRRFCRLVRQRLLEGGAAPEGAESTCRHIEARDFPIAAAEFESLCTRAGLHGRTLAYGSNDPLAAYIGAVVAARDPGLFARL